MSQHHRRIKHTSSNETQRKRIERMLPLPCVEGCGQPVTKDQTWHVAHLNPAMLGGKTTSTNVGPAHAKCNLRAGGRMGAAVTNAKRSTQEQTKEGRRSWL